MVVIRTQLAGLVLLPALLVTLIACDTYSEDVYFEDDVYSEDSSSEAWLSEQAPYRPGIVPTPVTVSSRSPFRSVSVGDKHICGVREDGSVDCGAFYAAPGGAFSSVSAGDKHTCGVRVDGSVACWGNNEHGQATPPPGAFASVSAGDKHTCGVRVDRSVACWGNNEGYDYGQAEPPQGEFASVSAGLYYTCGVRVDGSVACWGNNEHGQATPPPGPFASVSAGLRHTCGVRVDRSVACWGEAAEAISLPGASFRSVSVGWDFGCGVRQDGTVACWHLSDLSGMYDATRPPPGAFMSVSIRDDTACGVREDGSPVCWGEVPRRWHPTLSITDRTSGSLTLEWGDPREADSKLGGPFDYYQVHASRYPEGRYSLVTSSVDEGSHVHEGLEPGTAYTVVVLACDPFGCSSTAAVATTESEGPVSAPPTPTGFQGQKISIADWPDDARLTWNAADGATYYELWKGSDPDLPLEFLTQINAPLEAQSFDVAPNRRFFGEYSQTSWAVRACNEAGCSPFTGTVTIG